MTMIYDSLVDTMKVVKITHLSIGYSPVWRQLWAYNTPRDNCPVCIVETTKIKVSDNLIFEQCHCGFNS